MHFAILVYIDFGYVCIEEAIEITQKEANNIVEFFESNNLVNNADKAAILYNSKGKGKLLLKILEVKSSNLQTQKNF